MEMKYQRVPGVLRRELHGIIGSAKACYSYREAYKYVPSANVCQCVLRSVRECQENITEH